MGQLYLVPLLMLQKVNVIMRNKGVSWVMVTEVLVTFFVMPMVALMPLTESDKTVSTNHSPFTIPTIDKDAGKRA